MSTWLSGTSQRHPVLVESLAETFDGQWPDAMHAQEVRIGSGGDLSESLVARSGQDAPRWRGQ